MSPPFVYKLNINAAIVTDANMPAPTPAKPTYQQLVASALGDYKKQSAQSIVKEVAAKRGEADQNKCRHFVKLTLKRMVEKKLITQVKGTGATGSFKLLKVAAPKKKVVAKKVAKKVTKKPAAKKTTVAKKVAAKKAPKPSGAKKAPVKKAPTKKAPKAAAAPAKKAPTKRVIKAAAKAYRAAPVASAKKAKK